MNGTRSPLANPVSVVAGEPRNGATVPASGPRSPDATRSSVAEASPVGSQEKRGLLEANAPGSSSGIRHVTLNGGEDDANSEAETLIDSPVKRKEAERQQNIAARLGKPAKSRIGSLPVPSGDDDVSDSIVSPMQSTEVSDAKGTPSGDAKGDDLDEMDLGSSGSLSSAHSSPSEPHSRSLSRSPALPEQHDSNHLNPLKRKHRASSAGLPNKRQSMDPPKRQLRGMHSEDSAARLDRPGRSPSPNAHTHRRATSTQSAFLDGAADSSGRTRRAVSQFPVRDARSAKTGWEESDASSETTSHGHSDLRRPQRGIGRSTSTPGKPLGREHKRHVNKYGFTRLAEACEAGDLDLVKEWRDKDPDQLELAEYAENKPLQVAALNGNAEVVQYLIDQGCQIDCANVDKDTPLIDAAENGHLDVVCVLLHAGVDPLRQNLKGQQALDVVTDDTDDADGIRLALRQAIESWNSDGAKQRREEEEEQRHRAGPTKELHFMARTYENLLRLVTINDRNGVREFLDARVPVDNTIISAAAKTGDLYLVNMLLAEMTEKKAYQKAEKPMLGVLGSSHFEMVKSLTELDQFNPLYRSRAGKTWPELAVERNGPNWRREMELLQRLYDVQSSSKARRSSSPVTKHEHGTRRLASPKGDGESDAEGAPQRKNGRRLLSRRDMRAASGKALSDSGSDESDSEGALGPELSDDTSVRSSGSPQARGPARLRRDSPSSQRGHSSPRQIRRPSSSRVLTENVLATVNEKPEARLDAGDEQEKNHSEGAKFALDKAQRLEAKLKEEAETEAEAKRVEGIARKAEEERQAEETRIKLEEEETRMAEETLRRQEELRKQEVEEQEERRKREAQIAETRRKHHAEVLESLPPILRSPLDPGSAFTYDGMADRRYLIEYFTPLLVVKLGNAGLQDRPGATAYDLWVLNAQVAPLLGKRGMELMFHRSSLGFEETFTEGWLRHDDFSTPERRMAERVASEVAYQVDRADVQYDLPWEQTKEQMARHINVRMEGKRRLLDGSSALYCVRLDDVLRHLHPVLKGVRIEVGSLDTLRPQDTATYDTPMLPRTYVDGRVVARPSHTRQIAEAVVVHEK